MRGEKRRRVEWLVLVLAVMILGMVGAFTVAAWTDGGSWAPHEWVGAVALAGGMVAAVLAAVGLMTRRH